MNTIFVVAVAVIMTIAVISFVGIVVCLYSNKRRFSKSKSSIADNYLQKDRKAICRQLSNVRCMYDLCKSDLQMYLSEYNKCISDMKCCNIDNADKLTERYLALKRELALTRADLKLLKDDYSSLSRVLSIIDKKTVAEA